jgi:hypothetical protein
VEQILEQILAEVKAGNAKIPLGFGHPPKPRYIYANRSNPPHLWYMWSSNDNAPIQIEHDALTGTIVKLEIEDKDFRGKLDPKVNLTIQADRTYIIQSGLETEFTKGLLQALDMADLSGVTTIAVEAGGTDTVLFCRVYNSEGRSYYNPEWKEARCDTDTLRQLADRIQAKLGHPPSTPEAPPAATAKAKPVVGKPAVKAVEPAVVEDDEITGEWSIEDAPEVDRDTLMTESSKLAKAMGWNGQRAKKFITEEFPGCESRDDLNDDQLLTLVTEWQSLAKVAA